MFDLLESLRVSGVGLYIGSIYLGTPTCADDVLLLSNHPPELQAMLDVSSTYSEEHHYEIHPIKTTSTILYKPRKATPEIENLSWKLKDKDIPAQGEFTHLGLEWTAGKAHPNIDKSISAARRTTYALFGTGLHGRNGLDPVTSMKIVQLYILPRLVHGLDAAVLPRSQIEKLETAYRKLLRMLQSLPESTAAEAVYLLLGALPLEAILHQRIFALFGNITRLDNDNPLKALALRQLALKDDKSKSWFCKIQELATTYHIEINKAIMIPWPKQSWKTYSKKAIVSFWHLKLIRDAQSKSTLKHIIWDSSALNPHGVWVACEGRPGLVEAASTRARIMVQRYNINCVRWRQLKEETTSCPLCGHANEDLEHFLITCPKLSEARKDAITEIQNLYCKENIDPPSTTSEVVSAILNGDRYARGSPGGDYTGGPEVLQLGSIAGHQLCTTLCTKLHRKREEILNDLTDSHPHANTHC